MKRNNNISKPIYDEMKVDEAVKLAIPFNNGGLVSNYKKDARKP
jgi:hypothetical protein